MRILSSKKNIIVSIILLLSVGLSSIYILLRSHDRWEKFTEQELNVLSDVNDAKFTLADAHLRFEESLTSGEKLDSDKIFKSLERATENIRVAMYLESTSMNIDYELVKELDSLKSLMVEYEEIAQKDWRESEKIGNGSPLDQFFDKMYAEFIAKTDKIEADLLEHLKDSKMKHHKLINESMILLGFILILACVILFLSNKKIVKDEMELNRVNDELNSSNEELAATNEELNAANEEFEAVNEELNVANEELNATNEDLIREIKEREKVENTLIQERNKVDAILASIGDGMSIQDRDFNIIYKNKFIEKYFGPDIIDKKCYEVYERRDKICEGCPVKITFETGDITRTIRKGTDMAGNTVHVDVTASPIRNENGEIIGGIELIKDVTEQIKSGKEREKLIGELKEALSKVKTLNSLLPICSSCKKIRDDKGYWNQIESYIAKHTDSLFTHGLCPDCAKRLYPELSEDFFKDVFSDEKK